VCVPYPALPLTVDNAFEAVKTVRSWKELADWLMFWYDKEKLAAIEHRHISDEARLKAVVEAFLLGEGLYQPSWRMLIHRLYWVGKRHLAEKIKTNAEPHQGEWVSAWIEPHSGERACKGHSTYVDGESLIVTKNSTNIQ
jgi:hypothetical protein